MFAKKMKNNRITSWIAKVTAVFMVLCVITACSKSDDDSGENRGGGLTPDPNIPTLSDVKYELAPTATIVPETTAKQITAVDTTGHKFTLPVSAGKPEVGQTLIINTPTKDLHDGLLAKVVSVSETGAGYVVNYENAELTDAFKSVNIPESYIPINSYVEHIYDAQGNEVNFKRAPTTRASGNNTIEIILPEIGWKLGKSGFELTPKMTIDLAMRYVMQCADYEIDFADFKVDAEITLGADLALTLKEAKLLDQKIPLVTVYFAAIPVGPIVITPFVDIQGIVKIDGKVTIEASVSYKRVVHAHFNYQKGHGLDGSKITRDPEAPDALQYTFGPKFEGGFSYGLSVGASLGLYGKGFALGGEIDFCKRFTISGKLDVAALTGTSSDLLTTMTLATNPLFAWSSLKKWDFMKWEDLMLNESVILQGRATVTFAWKRLFDLNIPEMSIPVDSSPIMPQVQIVDNDFFSFNDKDVTLTLHHTNKSVLDDLTEFRAEFRRQGAKPNEQPIVKYFNFDDDKRNWLKAEVKGKDITSQAKATLSGEDNYDITVYMTILDVDLPIFQGYAKIEEDEKRMPVKEVSISIYGTFHYWAKDEMLSSQLGSSFTFTDKEKATVTSKETGNNLHVECTGKDWSDADGTLSFDIIDWKNLSNKNFKSFKIVNVKYHVAGSQTVSAELTDIPVKEVLVEGIDTEATISDGVKFNSFDYKDGSTYTYEFAPSPDDKVMIDVFLRQEYWRW